MQQQVAELAAAGGGEVDPPRLKMWKRCSSVLSSL